MRRDGKLIGCMVRGERLSFWMNERAGSPIKPEDYNGISLYWCPRDIHAMRRHLLELGFSASTIENRDYGQTEFFMTDDDGHTHCFGVDTATLGKQSST